MSHLWHRVFKFRPVNIAFMSAILLVFSGSLWAIVALHSLSPSIILHWVNDEDVSPITQIVLTKDIPLYLGVIGASALLMVIVNGWLALLFEERHQFWGKFLAGVTLLFAALIFIGFVAIIAVN